MNIEFSHLIWDKRIENFHFKIDKFSRLTWDKRDRTFPPILLGQKVPIVWFKNLIVSLTIEENYRFSYVSWEIELSNSF